MWLLCFCGWLPGCCYDVYTPVKKNSVNHFRMRVEAIKSFPILAEVTRTITNSNLSIIIHEVCLIQKLFLRLYQPKPAARWPSNWSEVSWDCPWERDASPSVFSSQHLCVRLRRVQRITDKPQIFTWKTSTGRTDGVEGNWYMQHCGEGQDMIICDESIITSQKSPSKHFQVIH